MMNKWTLLLVLWGWSAALHAESYIVLFKNQPSLVVGKEAHKQQMQSKRASNSERIDKLLAALGANKSTVAYQDLWLVSGMEISLKSDEVSQVKKIDFVERVLVNQKRKYIAPVTREAPVVMDPGWGLRRLNIDLIRSTYPEATGAGVRVGVIDTGIQSRHPEFEKKNKVVFKDFVNGIIYPYDDNGHGTHVSGTIAGATTGVAPNVDLIVAKAFSATGSASDAWLLLAMQWMFDPDGNPETEDYPHVVSNSWGLDIPFDIVDLAEFEAFHRAIVAWVESDIVPVVAAGNSGASPNGMPGGFAEVLSIAAFDATNNIAEFSSRGPNYWRAGRNVLNVFKPDLAAPGVDIYSAMPGNSYEYMSGTSMATPHATGSIALVLQKTGRTTVADLKTILLYSMEPKFDFDFGSGIINPLAALQLLGEPSKRSLSR